MSSPSVHAVLGRTDISDWQVLSAAINSAADSTSANEAGELLDLLGLRTRATQLAIGSAGRTGWLARQIARLSKAEGSEMTREELADRIADFIGSEQGFEGAVVGQISTDIETPNITDFNVVRPDGKLFVVQVRG